MIARWARATTIVGLVAVAACSGSDSATGTPVSAPTSDPVSTSESSDTAPATPAPVDEAAPDGTDVTDGTDGETTAPSSTLPVAERVEAACETLQGDGFETRRSILGDDEILDGVAARCEQDLQRLTAAVDLREQTAEIARSEQPVTISGVSCSNGEYQFIATNPLDTAIGVHASFRVILEDDDEPIYSGDYPVVIWQLEPGAGQGITGTYAVPDEPHRCTVAARVFNADISEVGAGLAEPSNPALTGDDPADWFGAMLDLEVRSTGSENADAAAAVEDIRSVGYANVLELTSGSDPIDRAPISVTICNGTVDQPSPERMSFVYSITYPIVGEPDATESFLRHGLFRRGTDGQWRWLSSPQFFSSPVFASCGPGGQ